MANETKRFAVDVPEELFLSFGEFCNAREITYAKAIQNMVIFVMKLKNNDVISRLFGQVPCESPDKIFTEVGIDRLLERKAAHEERSHASPYDPAK